MKKISALFLILVLCASVAYAQQQGKQAQDRSKVADQVRDRVQEHRELLAAQALNASNAEMLQNQNRVRVAAMALNTLRLEGNLSGGLGQNISRIAAGFNNSVAATMRAEERIQNRRGFMRTLFGGDENAAAELDAELERNRLRLQELQGIRAQLDPEYRGLVEEQIQLMEQEQTRLRELAEKERRDRGLLGWLFR